MPKRTEALLRSKLLSEKIGEGFEERIVTSIFTKLLRFSAKGNLSSGLGYDAFGLGRRDGI